jgi:hypothetical protein
MTAPDLAGVSGACSNSNTAPGSQQLDGGGWLLSRGCISGDGRVEKWPCNRLSVETGGNRVVERWKLEARDTPRRSITHSVLLFQTLF